MWNKFGLQEQNVFCLFLSFWHKYKDIALYVDVKKMVYCGVTSFCTPRNARGPPGIHACGTSQGRLSSYSPYYISLRFIVDRIKVVESRIIQIATISNNDSRLS